MTEPLTTAKIERLERAGGRYVSMGLFLVVGSFLAYGIGIWTRDGRWGWTGLLMDIVAVLLLVLYGATFGVAEAQREKLAKTSAADL